MADPSEPLASVEEAEIPLGSVVRIGINEITFHIAHAIAPIRRFFVKIGSTVHRAWLRLAQPKRVEITKAAVTPPIAWATCSVLAGTAVASLGIGTLLVHEYAHYFTARAVHAEAVWLPLLVPIFVGALGRTHFIESNPIKIRKIAMAGPIAGSIVATGLLATGIFIGAELLVTAGIVFGAVEILNAIFGTDGRIFRKAGRQLKTAHQSARAARVRRSQTIPATAQNVVR